MTTAGSHILLVEDNEATRYAVARILTSAGYRVTTAADGETGLRLVRELRPDLVLLDVKLPDVSGFDVVRRLKLDPDTSDVPVVHLSGTSISSAERVRGLEGGADAYLTHPVEPQVLVATLNALLRVRSAEARYRRIFGTGLLGIVSWDEQGVIVDANDAFLRLVGYDREDLAAGRLRWEALTGHAPPPPTEESGDRSAAEVQLRRRDGGHTPVLMGRAADDRHDASVAFVLDISERKRAEEALRESDRRKDEFLGMLSHELRNPLAPIRNSVYILEHVEAGSAAAVKARTVIKRQTEHLTRLVDDLLDVTRIARGKIELRPSRIDLREVVLRAVDDFRATMDDRGIRFRTDVTDAPLWADADATRVTQLVGNLLHNAAKFSRNGDEVRLALGPVDGMAELSVRDTGVGIDAAVLPNVFEAFVQGERTLARTQGGLGLGLALVKAIADLHHGSVRATSGGKGRGSEFVVRLPLVPAAPPRPQPEGEPQAPARGRQILVVDDNRDAAESLADLVRMLGHTAAVAYDGPTALALARERSPAVVLCDIGLPLMSGYEVARALRAEGHRSRLVALTGYAQPEHAVLAAEAGFDAHVAKPCTPDEIASLIG